MSSPIGNISRKKGLVTGDKQTIPIITQILALTLMATYNKKSVTRPTKVP
jgi:hypothetical protein